MKRKSITGELEVCVVDYEEYEAYIDGESLTYWIEEALAEQRGKPVKTLLSSTTPYGRVRITVSVIE